MRDATLNIATGELIEHGIDCPLCDHCATAYDTLEAVAYKLQRERNVALEQRDALLAALRYSVKQMAAFIGDRGIDHPMYVALIEARAAIAACEVQS